MVKNRNPEEVHQCDKRQRVNNILKGTVIDKNGVHRLPRAKNTDWEFLRIAFINAYDKELIEFCFEFTKNVDDPKYKSVERKARNEKWDDLKRIKMANDPSYMGKLTEDLSVFDYTTAETVRDSRLKLVDANNTIQKHLETADDLHKIARFHLPKILAASELIDWESLAMDDPKTFFSATKDIAALFDLAVKIERISLDLANVKIDIVQTQQEKPKIDYSKLTDIELSSLYSDNIRTIDINNA